MVNVALPAIVGELGGGITTQQWTVDAYLITLGALMLVAGSVSDTYGRLRVIRWGLIGFGVTSVAIAAAPTAGVLIVARLLQGVAGALLVPGSLALITANFRDKAQGKAIGTWTAATSGAMVAGPVIGGIFIDLWSWRLVFLINVLPIAITLVLLGRLAQRDVRLPDAHIDVVSAALCAAGLGGAVYALIEQPHLGWSHPQVWLPGLAGTAALVAFVWRQVVVERPMLPLSLVPRPQLRVGQPLHVPGVRRAVAQRLRHHRLPAGDCRPQRHRRGSREPPHHPHHDRAEAPRWAPSLAASAHACS
ncbi:hypothetical protein GCM10025876_31150 [Demequina litorisediminis]|uniref:Major facilitator superfamily (MFS) profile domain-containing protein n=1 Tax=Demequina litorisediminis TaxID=1849022 RepID=A0ABQ6IGQ0_9MICO|nr:hypothetical protein GCM10025876_31150 [Demequina litorisediminis]